MFCLPWSRTSAFQKLADELLQLLEKDKLFARQEIAKHQKHIDASVSKIKSELNLGHNFQAQTYAMEVATYKSLQKMHEHSFAQLEEQRKRVGQLLIEWNSLRQSAETVFQTEKLVTMATNADTDDSDDSLNTAQADFEDSGEVEKHTSGVHQRLREAADALHSTRILRFSEPDGQHIKTEARRIMLDIQAEQGHDDGTSSFTTRDGVEQFAPRDGTDAEGATAL